MKKMQETQAPTQPTTPRQRDPNERIVIGTHSQANAPIKKRIVRTTSEYIEPLDIERDEDSDSEYDQEDVKEDEESDDEEEEETPQKPIAKKNIKKEQYLSIPIEQKLTYKISSEVTKPSVNFGDNSPDVKKILLYVTHVEELVSLLQSLKSIITGIAPSIDVGPRIELNVNNLQIALSKSLRNSQKKRKRSRNAPGRELSKEDAEKLARRVKELIPDVQEIVPVCEKEQE
jgi:hypothetical protein